MTNSIRFTLVLGVLAIVTVLAAQGQVQQQTAIGSVRTAWPPPPQNIVNSWVSGGPQILPGETIPIYHVPAGTWLVLSDLHVSDTGYNGYHLRVVEMGATGETAKGLPRLVVPPNVGTSNQIPFPPAGSGGAIGWTFAPNTQVGIRNVGTESISLNTYGLLGYLSR